jgi:hypothetical protein
MLADFSVELGRDDPALELPWSSEDGSVCYLDLKAQPDDVRHIPEAAAHPELGAFLVRMNAPGFSLLTAKCDAWGSREIFPEEEIFQAECKFVSYVDLVFVAEGVRSSLVSHERFARELCRLLQCVPAIAASTELCIRHCYWHFDDELNEPADDELDETAPLEEDSGSPHGNNRSVMPPVEPADFLSEDLLSAADSETSGKSVSQRGVGFYLSVYVTGFGDTEDDARRTWGIALTLVQNAVVQLAGR